MLAIFILAAIFKLAMSRLAMGAVKEAKRTTSRWLQRPRRRLPYKTNKQTNKEEVTKQNIFAFDNIIAGR